MSVTRRLSLLSIALLMVAVAATPASAATFTPAGHSFTAGPAPVAFQFVHAAPLGYNTIGCASSSTSGTLANPASATAPVAAPAFNSCTVGGGVTATATTSGSWQLQASSTTAVSLLGGSLVLKVFVGGTLACTLTSNSLLSAAGTWSNPLQRLTFNWGVNTIAFTKTGAALGCPGSYPNEPTVSRASLIGTYNIANTTSPGTPITVQP